MPSRSPIRREPIPSQIGLAEKNGRRGRNRCDDDADERGTVFQNHHESRRILTPSDRLEGTYFPRRIPKSTPGNSQGYSLKQEGEAENEIGNPRVPDRLGLNDTHHTLIQRNGGSERKQKQRNDKTPEIELPSVAERMKPVRRTVWRGNSRKGATTRSKYLRRNEWLHSSLPNYRSRVRRQALSPRQAHFPATQHRLLFSMNAACSCSGTIDDVKQGKRGHEC